MLGTGEGSQGSTPQSSLACPRESDRGSPLNLGLLGYDMESL
jgi:hypothetical protein